MASHLDTTPTFEAGELIRITHVWKQHLDASGLQADDARSIVLRSGLFNDRFYFSTYPDVAIASMNALDHFVDHGACEGRIPNRWFDPGFYRSQLNGAVVANPLLDYIEHGERAGLKPHPKFDPVRYRRIFSVVDAANVSPLWHFLHFGLAHLPDTELLDETDQRFIVDLSGLFDGDFYRETYPDIKAANVDPLDHFIAHGARERRAPNRWFDAHFYRAQFGTFSEDNALIDYIRHGERAGFKPHPNFDPRRYRDLFPEVDLENESPLWHFMYRGAEEYIEAVRPKGYQAAAHIDPVKPLLRRWERATHAEIGANFVSPAHVISGLGVSARGFIDALSTARVPLHMVEWSRGFEHQPKGDFKLESVEPLQPINLIHMNADIFHLVSNELRLNGILSSDRYNIGIWYWELATFRQEWMPWIALLDEIWCASSFNARAIDVVSARPVKLVRPAVTPLAAPGTFPRSHFGLGNDSTAFFYSCDLSSGIDRKNPETLIRAFRQEFGDDINYQLVLKIGNATNYQEAFRRIIKAGGIARNIVLIDRTLSDPELADLLQHTFAYVSPHRAEGLGLTIIEAMLAGCPVIATPYGGAADFVFDGVARPLSFDLDEIQQTDEPYRRGCVWADPHLADIRRAMRQLTDDREATRAMSQRGKAHAASLFSREATAHVVRKRLEEIWAENDRTQP